jgi:acetyl esterase/lipase
MSRPFAASSVVAAVAALLIAPGTSASRGDETPGFDRKEDVIYGRKFGTALTLDVFTPRGKPNGAGLVMLVSGGWGSNHDHIGTFWTKLVGPFAERGYTVFAVVHGSQPRYTVPECVADVKRAVRYIRTHAKDFGIEPGRLGVLGGSAGGHLSLMLGTTSDPGDPKSDDPVDRASCRVGAVASFFPPTDFLNYGKSGANALGRGVLEWLPAPFAFNEFDATRHVFVPVVDEAERLRIGRAISPAYHATPDDAPALIIHGDADTLVPLQQAERMVKALDAAGVPAKLVVRPGMGHGWPKDLPHDLNLFADWFDKHLGPGKGSSPGS